MVLATFDGDDRKLVIAIDVGTTFSGAAFWSVATSDLKPSFFTLTWFLACSTQGVKSRYKGSIGHEFIGP